ncbi:MAG TPA: NADH-quinone oxidoreductase subunit NuoH [Chloroflexota bacterium]|nr:NADH-quinone oxidoreductase subunit NuoH [Chloroflexota bacterium]
MNDWGDVLVTGIIKSVIALALLMAGGGLLTLMERKILGRLQTRYGPIRVGPFGLLQPLADGLKMLLKEQPVPANAKIGVYLVAPAISLFVAFMAFAIVPVGPSFFLFGKMRTLSVTNVNIGMLYLLAILSLGVYGVVLGAWSSANRYSLLGGLRAGAQMISYEISLGLAILGVVVLAGTLSPIGIVEAQKAPGMTWFVFLQPVGFFLFMIGGVAETNRAPFDLVEAEQELIGGYFTEYGGMRWGLYMLAEYINMLTVSALVATLFLGGWIGIGTGILWTVTAAPWAQLLGVFWFFVKVAFFIFVYFWFRATLPRIRYDQLMGFGWKVLLPLSVLNMLVTALYVSLR